MTDREAPPDVGFDHPQADPYDDGWFGGEQAAAPTYVDDVPTPPHGEPVIHVPEERFVAPPEAAPAPAPPAPPVPTPTVNTWTVDDPARMRLLAGWGVDGIVTNTPDVLVQALRERRP